MAQCLRVLTTALIAVTILAADALGRRLLEVDGVELHGDAQLAMSGGGTCNVLESDTNYEAKKENHGAPMDIWRLDFTVRNGSGRWLDHLIARFQIESEWPDCTNWDGPGAGQFAQPVEWADSASHIQESGRNVVAPGQTLTQTKFFIILRGDPQPRFANWSMDFDFAAGSSSGPGSPASVPAMSAEVDTVFWQSITNSTDPADFEAYLRQFPQGVFRALAQNRLAALRAAGSDSRAVAAAAGNAGAARVAQGGPAGIGATVEPRAGETRAFDGMAFVWVPAGEFRMGSTSAEADYDEQPVTRVRISRGFWLGKHEVTQSEWQAVTGSNPSAFDECGPDCPVEQVSWNDAQAFISALNGRAVGSRYRLPTEAEWEYAARAGTSGDRYGNLGAIAWYDGNSGGRTHPVGQKAPNAWGLHDMLGNVWEWVQDWYGDYPGGAVTDPRGPLSGSSPVFRGGSWRYCASGCRASSRNSFSPGYRPAYLGFRLLRTE